MHLQILGSGSGGNAALVRAGELMLLIDAGLALDELERRLDEVKVPPRRLDAIALTHGHLDHARAAGLLSKKSGARLYCSEAMMSNASVRRAHSLCVLPVGGRVTVRSRVGRDELVLHAIPLPHDADPTLALRIEHQGRAAAVCTDLGTPDEAVGRALAGVQLLVLEFNHDPALLAAGPYTPALKRRVGGPRGHLSNAQASELLRHAAGPELHTLVLAHLSATNNTVALATAAAAATLRALGRAEVRLLVAEQDRVGPSLAV